MLVNGRALTTPEQIYVRDLQTGVTGLASTDALGNPATAPEGFEINYSSISVSDSGVVLFASDANGLTPADNNGAFDVFIYDLKTKNIERVTQNSGSNQSPDWSPDGRLLVYSSGRGGLWVTNPETHKEIQIYKGAAASPSFGHSQPSRRPT